MDSKGNAHFDNAVRLMQTPFDDVDKAVKIVQEQAAPFSRVIEWISQKPYAIFGSRKGEPATKTIPLDRRAITLEAAEALAKNRLHVFLVDDVAAEISHGYESALHAALDTPRPMAPFEHCWVEGTTDTSGLGNADGTAMNDFTSVGVYVKTGSLLKDSVVNFPVLSVRERVESAIKDGRVLNVFPYVKRSDGTCYGPLSVTTVYLAEDFEIMSMSEDEHTAMFGSPPEKTETHKGRIPMIFRWSMIQPGDYAGGDKAYMDANAIFAVALALRTFGLLNAANIETVESHTNNHVREKQRYKERLAWVKYSTLVVRRGKHTYPIRPKQADGTGAGKALHMVRGHFKDYSEKGVFGKYKGEKYSHVWCPAFARGAVENGVSVRDYEVKTS